MKLSGLLTALNVAASVARASANLVQTIEARTGAGSGAIVGAVAGGALYALGADETTTVSVGVAVATATAAVVSLFGRPQPNVLIVKAGKDRQAVINRIQTGKGIVTLYAIRPPKKPAALRFEYSVGVGTDGMVYDLNTYEKLGEYWGKLE